MFRMGSGCDDVDHCAAAVWVWTYDVGQLVGGTIAGGLLAALLVAGCIARAGVIAVITVTSVLTLATYAVDYAVVLLLSDADLCADESAAPAATGTLPECGWGRRCWERRSRWWRCACCGRTRADELGKLLGRE